MRRLTKSDVERLMAAYDADPIGALSRALAILLGSGRGASMEWGDTVRSCGFDRNRREALLSHDTAALDELVRDLVELRRLPPSGPGAGDGAHRDAEPD